MKVDSIKNQRLYQSIKKNQTLEYELIDSDGITAEADVDNIKIYCRYDNAWMDVTLIPISYVASGNQWKPKPEDTKKYLFPCYDFLGSSYPITGLNPTYSYRVVLRALYADTSSVDLVAFNGTNEVGVGGKFTVRAWADYSAFSRQEMKGISTISSLFDNVLYSEQAIVKDILPGTT